MKEMQEKKECPLLLWFLSSSKVGFFSKLPALCGSRHTSMKKLKRSKYLVFEHLGTKISIFELFAHCNCNVGVPCLFSVKIANSPYRPRQRFLDEMPLTL